MSKRSPFQNKAERLTLENLEGVIQILGLIDSKGYFLKGNQIETKIIYDDIQRILDLIEQDSKTKDSTRRIQTAREIFNHASDRIKIGGSKSGTDFKCNQTNISSTQLKKEKIYQLFLTLYLALLSYKNIVQIDFLSQLIESEYPIDLLTCLTFAIKNSYPVRFQYESNRKKETLNIVNFIPVTIYHKDGHWLLVGWDDGAKSWNQYLIHSIQKLNFNDINSLKKSQIPKFNYNEFRKNSFGIAVMNRQKHYEIEIEVSSEEMKAVKKRRSEGTWKKNGQNWIWTIKTFDPSEVFDYVFKWNGLLKIIGPKDMVAKFREKVMKFL